MILLKDALEVLKELSGNIDVCIRRVYCSKGEDEEDCYNGNICNIPSNFPYLRREVRAIYPVSKTESLLPDEWNKADYFDIAITDIDIDSELRELETSIHDNAINHGWWEYPQRSFAEIIALCHSELSEALEEERNDMPNEYFIDTTTGERVTDMRKWNGEKTEGRAVEMADCIIRILDWCGEYGIDMDAIIRRKHQYNTSRPYKHGGKKL